MSQLPLSGAHRERSNKQGNKTPTVKQLNKARELELDPEQSVLFFAAGALLAVTMTLTSWPVCI